MFKGDENMRKYLKHIIIGVLIIGIIIFGFLSYYKPSVEICDCTCACENCKCSTMKVPKDECVCCCENCNCDCSTNNIED